MDFPHQAGTWNFTRKRSVRQQMAHFGAQEQQTTPKDGRDQAGQA
jgi:hypothetical protein